MALTAEAWRRLLPAGVEVCAGAYPSDVASMPAGEAESLGAATASRLREFGAGRLYAKRALAALGWPPSDLLRRSAGAPEWPSGVVGSITHAVRSADSHAAAAVARKREFAGVGIDIEPERSVPPGVWTFALTDRERRALAALPVVDRAAFVTQLWCAKEATLKAIGIPTELGRIDIDLNPAEGRFQAIRLDGSEPVGSGRTCTHEGWVLAAMVIPAS